MKGSAYCVDHEKLCRIAPSSRSGASASRALDAVGETAPPPPPELGFLQTLPIPECEIDDESAHEISRTYDLEDAINDAAEAARSAGEP